jgi:sec-independent protein translocase protein TatA
MSPLFAILGLGWGEILVIGVIAVLLFGRRLPDMAKYLGKSVVEFKKGMHGLETGFDDVANPSAGTPAAPNAAPAEAIRPPQRVAPAAPKFDDAPVNSQVTANPPQP